MTAYTAYYRSSTGLNLYAKPFPLTNPWATDAIALTPGVGGQYSFTADSDLSYLIFLRAGGSPASTDVDEAFIGTNPNVPISIIASQLGTGATALVATVTNNAVAIPAAVVTVSSGSTLVAWGPTNSSGQITFQLAAGTYSVSVQSSPGYQPFTPVSVTVPQSTSVSLALQSQSITPPQDPGLCAVRFLVLDKGVPVQGAKVRVELEDSNPMVNTALISRATTNGTTNAQGIVDLTMIQTASFTRGGVYQVVVSDPQGRRLHDRRVTVPTVSSTFAEDLPDAP